MSDREKLRFRPLVFNFWHRIDSLSRFMSREEARSCCMIDINVLEYRELGGRPLALMEVAKETSKQKSHWVLKALAKAADIPAFVVRYISSDYPNPADNYKGNCPLCGQKTSGLDLLRFRDIESFKVQQIHPIGTAFIDYSPGEFAQKILCIHRKVKEP